MITFKMVHGTRLINPILSLIYASASFLCENLELSPRSRICF